jgi:O-acetyl-ADP-ribose deacetylase (regulator of RNase III)
VAELQLLQGDITKVEVDAIVNAANSSLMGGGGVDGAIHRAGGPAILAECREVVARQGGCPPGEAVATGAGELPARWVIHTVGPIWTAADAEAHDRTLGSAYRRSLEVAGELGAVSVAFPNISTGVYGFPKRRAADVAVTAVQETVADVPTIERVVFVAFDDENHALYRERLRSA